MHAGKVKPTDGPGDDGADHVNSSDTSLSHSNNDGDDFDNSTSTRQDTNSGDDAQASSTSSSSTASVSAPDDCDVDENDSVSLQNSPQDQQAWRQRISENSSNCFKSSKNESQTISGQNAHQPRRDNELPGFFLSEGDGSFANDQFPESHVTTTSNDVPTSYDNDAGESRQNSGDNPFEQYEPNRETVDDFEASPFEEIDLEETLSEGRNEPKYSLIESNSNPFTKDKMDRSKSLKATIPGQKLNFNLFQDIIGSSSSTDEFEAGDDFEHRRKQISDMHYEETNRSRFDSIMTTSDDDDATTSNLSVSPEFSQTPSEINNDAIGDSGAANKTMLSSTIESQTIHTTSSISRRRRHFQKMGVISEFPCDTHNSGNDLQDERNVDFQDAREVDEFEDAGNQSDSNNQSDSRLSFEDAENVRNNQSFRSIDAATVSSVSSTSSTSYSSRLRTRNSGEASVSRSIGSLGGTSSSADSRRGGSLDRGIGRGSVARRRAGRRLSGRLSPTAEDSILTEGENENDDEAGERRRRIFGRRESSTGLVASLDAGMAALRRWIRSRRPTTSSAASASGQSVSSSSALRLGEEDVAALSHAGSRPRRGNTGSSTSSNSYLLDSNSSSGFLYYRPFEVHVPHGAETDDGGLYTSDDESGTRSILLHPLIPADPSDSSPAQTQQRRQRAFSEPDRARLVDFFNSVYASRAIDGGTGRRARNRAGTSQDEIGAVRSSGPRRVFGRQSPPRSANAIVQSNRDEGALTAASPTPVINEEDAEIIEDDAGVSQVRSQIDRDQQSRPPQIEVHDVATVSANYPAEHDLTIIGPEPPDSENQANITEIDSSTRAADPNRHARSRWIRINRRFQFIISMVAIMFSLLLFAILVCWVLLTSTYVISLEKDCDLPLKPYYWLATFQLALDIFRADIMKWMCRWRSDSGHRIPPRVVLYNMAYLIYAMLVLRVGAKSVFSSGGSACSKTAPELFFASFVFVSLSLAAWATIILGYLVPFCFVAMLLTRNGYFPNAETSSSAPVGGAGSGGPRVGMGIGMVSFPNAYSNPAPPGCVERLRVVLLDEFPDSFPKDCCICMSEFCAGEVIVETPCLHLYHKRCFKEWLQHSRTCPYCRTDITLALGLNEESTLEEQHDSVTEEEGEGDQISNAPREERREFRPNLLRYLRREHSNSAPNEASDNSRSVLHSSERNVSSTSELAV